MTNTTTLTAGIDTSKHKLDVAVHQASAHWQVENNVSGWRALAGHLAKAGVARVGIEASGGYELGVVRFLRAKRFSVLVLQPIQVRAYARLHLRRGEKENPRPGLIPAPAAPGGPPPSATPPPAGFGPRPARRRWSSRVRRPPCVWRDWRRILPLSNRSRRTSSASNPGSSISRMRACGASPRPTSRG